MIGEWEDVGAAGGQTLFTAETAADAHVDSAGTPLKAFLESKGLDKFAQKIIEVTDAESVEDLKLLDEADLSEVIAKVNMKLLSAKKMRLAVAELRGEALSLSAAAADADVPTAGSEAEDQRSPLDLASSPPTQPAAVAVSEPQECIAICIDRSGSMGAPISEVTLNIVRGATKDSVAQRTRMEAVKVMFYAFRDRVESLGQGSHQLGLLQFDDKIQKMLDLTPKLDLFEAILDDMQKRGMTAIYSAIAEAARMLEKHFSKDSQTDLRILVLTDGQSNTGVSAQEALEAANRIGATVDAILVGDRPDANLRRIVSATGGECYQVDDLGAGFELLEAEGVVSLRARRGGAEKPPFELRETVDLSAICEKPVTSGTAVQRRAPVQDHTPKAVVDIASQKGYEAIEAISNGSSAPARFLKRILKELKEVSIGTAGRGVHIFPAEENVMLWRALIEGPEDSPFEGGVFALSIRMPEDYPFSPPKITFETPVYHCNVSDAGAICLDILKEKWNPALTVHMCLLQICSMLKSPDTDNSLRQWIAELTLAYQKTNGADTRYFEKARECTQRDASLPIADWKQKWGC